MLCIECCIFIKQKEDSAQESESLEDKFPPQCSEVAALDIRLKGCFGEELTDHSKSGIEDTLTEDFSHVSEVAHFDSNLPGTHSLSFQSFRVLHI